MSDVARPCIGDGQSPCDENLMTRNFNQRCRDCDIQFLLNQMECPVCKRMRYRQDDARLGGLGEYLWGARCECPCP